jgi:N-acetylneuraminic acid mutarotase
LGIDGGDFAARDFWEWDQATNLWTRLADFPGKPRDYPVGFAIGTKGYILTESYVSANFDLSSEFWEYDPATNIWTQKASPPTTTARAVAVGFSIGTKGYVGLGIKDTFPGGGSTTEYYNDFWEWDQATNVWTRIADFPGNARVGSVGFSIGTKGYVGTGDDGTALTKDFWEWDQATNVWTKKAEFDGAPRAYAVGFSIGNKGYIGTGYNGNQTSYLYQDFWEWDQATDTWTRIADFAGGPRSEAVGVSIGNKAYIGTGMSGSIIYAFKDFWEYDQDLK